MLSERDRNDFVASGLLLKYIAAIRLSVAITL